MNKNLFAYGVITGIASVCALIWLILNFGHPCPTQEINHNNYAEVKGE